MAKLGGQAAPRPNPAGEGGSDGPAASQAVQDAGAQDSTAANASGPQADNTDKADVAMSDPKDTPAPPIKQDEPKPKINITSSSTTSLPQQNPFSQLGIEKVNGEPQRANATPPAGRPLTPLKRDRPLSSSGRSSSRAGETPEQWEDRILGNVFRLSLDSDHQVDGHGNRIHYLKATRNELEEQHEPLRLNTSLLDQVILEAASNLNKDTAPLVYLLGCWKRISRQYKALRKFGENDPKFAVIKEARRLCMSYCVFAITMPEMFGLVKLYLRRWDYAEVIIVSKAPVGVPSPHILWSMTPRMRGSSTLSFLTNWLHDAVKTKASHPLWLKPRNI